ncbi:MAG: PepSY domain-containing protein [Firmicutes bacterium]|nr:PepSY domain-containing protein [Bacillota bacterium]
MADINKRNADIEERLRESVNKITPDILDRILSDCEDQKGVVIQMRPKKNRIKKYVGIAAAFAVIVGSVFGYQGVTENALAASIMLDINPSVEIEVNKNEKVIDVVAKNEDGRVIIGDMELKGTNLDVAVNALVGSMLKEGYITEIQNSILVSVDGKDKAVNERLQNEVSKEIDEILAGGGFSGSVLSQTITKDTELEKFAEKYGITEGKAKLVKEIALKDNTKKVDELAKLTINELNLLNESEVRKVESVKASGKASDKAYIGYEKAKEIALKEAGVSRENVRDFECELDFERRVMVYEVEFEAGERSYEYDINAVTGEIVWKNSEVDDDYYDDKHYDDWDDKYDDDWDDKYDDDYVAPGSADIGRDKALSIAYNHAGVKAADVFELSCELDYDDGLAYYEIEFQAGNVEYEYDIKASDGTIVSHEKDIDD